MLFSTCNTLEKERFTFEDQRCLLRALAFPTDLFNRNIPCENFKEDFISVAAILECCESKFFYGDLHFTVNLKSAAYNNEILKKSVILLSNNKLSFADLQNARLAFEAYEEYDQRGLRLHERTLLRTLKLCNRVISPKKLMRKLRHVESAFKERGRIQFYEFLDLLVICDHVSSVELSDASTEVLEKTWRNVYCVENFKTFIVPKEKRLWKFLNEKYRREELEDEPPVLLSCGFVEKPIPTEEFSTQVKLSNKDYFTLQRKLKESSKQVRLAKGGGSQRRMHQKTPRSPASTSNRESSSRGEASGSDLAWPMFFQKGAQRRFSPSTTTTTVTAVPTHKSAPVGPANQKHEDKPVRSSSCPAVVSSASRDQTTIQMNHLKFEMHTEDRRWADYFTSEISQYLPNYDEVMARVRKPPAAPVKRKAYRPERPLPSAIRRLSEPKPTMPGNHVTHCDAITMGMGTDEHAVALQRHGCKYAPRTSSADRNDTRRKPKHCVRQSWRSLVKRKTTFLEKLLADVDRQSAKEADRLQQEPAADAADDEDEEEPSPDEASLQQVVELDSVAPQEDAAEAETDDASNGFDLSILKTRDKFADALAAMNDDVARIYLDPCRTEHLELERCHEAGFKWTSRDLRYERFPRPPSGRSVEVQTTEVTEFEKFLGDPENLRIPDDVFIGRTGKSRAELRRARKSFARITERFTGEQKKKVKSMLRGSTPIVAQ